MPSKAAKRNQKKVANPKANNNNNVINIVESGSDERVIEGERTVTGNLTSYPLSRDVKVESFSVSSYGRELICDTTLELNMGRRIGLIGANGSGKSTFLKAIAAREVPIPAHIDIFLLNEEAPPSEYTALEAVIAEVVKEQRRLETLAEEMAGNPDQENCQSLIEEIYEKLESMDPSSFQSRAAELLHGLGFSQTMMNKKTKDLSGGWRMRVALAKALFVKPTLLLLDEPTNHLDLEACVWLEEYLKTYEKILILVSHSQDFLNGVCTNIMHLHHTKLVYYSGNYSTYLKTREEKEVNQMKHYVKQQEEIEHIKKFIASCGTYANLVKQAKSKQKIIDKMEAAGLIQPVKKEPVFSFRFVDTGKLPTPILAFDNVSFAYSGKAEDYLYQAIDMGADLDSRIALVGPNGAGKSTLLKLMCGDIQPSKGNVSRHPHLKIGRYHQHSVEQLDLTLSPVDYFRAKFAHLNFDMETWRAKIGQFGITGNQQLNPMKNLSDGQQSRIVFCELYVLNPNMLLLDEPTNHLDIECIDSLADAINAFTGGVVLVSHDFRLINQVAKEIWLCDKKTITKWDGGIEAYKQHLKKNMKCA